MERNSNLTARHYASVVDAVVECPSVRRSIVGILLKWLNQKPNANSCRTMARRILFLDVEDLGESGRQIT